MPGKAQAENIALTSFITHSIESGFALEDVEEQLRKCHSDELLISKEVFAKAQQLATEEFAKKSSESSSATLCVSGASKSFAVEPLFCKDTVYHAGVCCQAVCDCSAGDYQKFFNNKELVPGHAFKAVSFSRSKKETFLIAQQGESTYYFAFKGRPCLSDWTKGCKSFSEGKVCYKYFEYE